MATKNKRTYTDPEGNIYPLYEAVADTAFTAYKSDRKRAKIGDPHHCIEALGIKRNKDVLDAYIGSGKDAYVVYKGGKRGPFCLHYTIPAQAAKVRDLFETKGAPATQIIWLRHPTAGRTLTARSAAGKRRRQEIKNGSPVKRRGLISIPRIVRLGVPHRPHAQVSQRGDVTTTISA